MVFVAKHIRYAIPEPLADHMARTWRVGIPFEKPVFVISPGSLAVRKVEGDTFAGNVTAGARAR